MSDFLKDHLWNFVLPQLCKFKGLPPTSENRKVCREILLKGHLLDSLDIKSVGAAESCSWLRYFTKRDILKGCDEALAKDLKRSSERAFITWDESLRKKLHKYLHDVMDVVEWHIPKDARLVLGGRDTWFLYVIAMKRKSLRDRTVHIPELNRTVSYSSDAIKMVAAKYSLTRKDFHFDTGFAGSIFRNMRTHIPDKTDFKRMMLMSSDGAYRMLAPCKKDMLELRLMGRHNIRELVTFFESIPKYWKSATTGYDARTTKRFIAIEPSDFKEFLASARLTMEVYK